MFLSSKVSRDFFSFTFRLGVFWIAIGLQFLVAFGLFGYKYDLAICAIFKNEAPYLKEWIEFHKLVGVQHFYLYNNQSSDTYIKVLEPYIANGEVDLIQWPYDTFEDIGRWNGIQCAAYNHAVKRAHSQTKWLAVLDTDEFLFSVETDNLVEFLSNYEDVVGICVSWQCFGTSHVKNIPPHMLMIDLLRHRGPVYEEANINIKSIVRPEFVLRFPSPHVAFYHPGHNQVNPNKEKFEGFIGPYIAVDKIRINHYWTRDEDFFFHTKIARRAAWGQEIESCLQWAEAMNKETDDAILHFVPQLKKAMGF